MCAQVNYTIKCIIVFFFHCQDAAANVATAATTAAAPATNLDEAPIHQPAAPDASPLIPTPGLEEDDVDGCDDIVYLVLSFAIRHGLSKAGIDDMLDLLRAARTKDIPSSKYMLLKDILDDIAEANDLHVFCGRCLAYIGLNDVPCAECGDATPKAKRLKEGNFFMYIPLQRQIKELLESGFIEANLVPPRADDGIIRDAVDGTVSRDVKGLRSPLGTTAVIDMSHLSLTWNIDGVPIHQSSKKSMHPILATINELRPDVRGQEVLMCGLWFGKGSPPWATYSVPFLKELADLSVTGIKWKRDNQDMTTLVSGHSIVCDAVARCSVQGVQQFNGAYGCGWCLQPTEPAERGEQTAENDGNVSGRALVRIYPFETGVEPRTHENVIECAREAAAKNMPHCKGVKHASPMLLLPKETGVDIVRSFSVDYMHAVLLGVVRQFMRLWFSPEHGGADYSSRGSTERASQRLTSIRPPHDVARLPRSVEDLDCWKASECRSWLIYYSVPVMCGILPDALFNHWCLLVSAMYILLGEEIDERGIRRAEGLLRSFVRKTASLYGLRHMSSNVHVLLHLPDTVRRLGPLWACSAFPFERYMMTIKRKLFHGTTYIPQQVASNFMMLRFIRRWIGEAVTPERELVKKWLGYPDTVHGLRSDEGVVGLQRHLFSLGEREADLLNALGIDAAAGASVDSFNRAILNNKVVCTEQYGKNQKRNSYTLSTKFGICSVQNIFFLSSGSSRRAFLVVTLFKDTPHSYPSITHIRTVQETTTTMLCRPSDVYGSVVVAKEGSRSKICALQPNRYEKD